MEIPGTEGRAGMAAIPDPERGVDLTKLYAGMVDKLPSYARPIFLRFVEEIDVTGWYFPSKMNEISLLLFSRDLQNEEKRFTA